MSEFLRDLEKRFIWRRAFRSAQRCVVRADLMNAFDMSGNKASALLTNVANESDGSMVREGNKVIAKGWASPPFFAGEVDLMDHISRGLTDIEFTGLKPDELPINRVVWSQNLPSSPGALQKIVSCICTKKPIWILYVGMDKGNAGNWRRVMPLSLDCLGEQWRVSAQDLKLEKEHYPVRTFVLTRILDAKDDLEKLPSKFIRASGFDVNRKIPVEFNPLLTKEQMSVLKHEFLIKTGRVDLPERSVYEFFIKYAGNEVSSNSVWPPIRQIDTSTVTPWVKDK